MKRRPAPLEAPLARTNFMSDYTYTRHLHARIHSTPGHVSTDEIIVLSLCVSLSRYKGPYLSSITHGTPSQSTTQPAHSAHLSSHSISRAFRHTTHKPRTRRRLALQTLARARGAKRDNKKTRQNSQLVRRGARRRDEQPHPGRHRGLLCWRAHQLRLLWATVPRHVLRVPHRALRRLELLLLLERLH